MSNATSAYVNFDDAISSGKLDKQTMKELKSIEGILNLTPSVKVKNSKPARYEASPTNVAVMKHLATTIRKIVGMVDQGLSYSFGDYYIFVQFGGKPSVTKSPNGIIKAISKLASKQGYLANINVGCIFANYEHFRVKRNGLIDNLELINSPEHEIGVQCGNDILAPYAVVTLTNKKDGKILSSKVTIVRNGEYKNAKAQGSATHQSYPVPMAEKIALKRAGEQMAASLGIDDSVELDQLRSEINDHNAEYDLNRNTAPKVALNITNEPKTQEPEIITDQGDTLGKTENTQSLDDL